MVSTNGADVSMEERNQIMEFLERAVKSSIRGVDVTTRYSSTQRIVLLMNMDRKLINVVTDRIMKQFYKMCDNRQISVHCDVADLTEE